MIKSLVERLKSRISKTRKTVIAASVLLIFIAFFNIIYLLFGHALVRFIFNVDLHMADIYAIKYSIYLAAVSAALLLPTNIKIIIASLAFITILLQIGSKCHSIYLDLKYPQGTSEEMMYEYDSILGWKNSPGAQGYFSSRLSRFRAKININSKGLRDEEYPYQTPDGTLRILLLGNSTVVGFEVDKKHLVDTQMEKFLNKFNRDFHYEVINCGTRGYGTDQSYLFLTNEGYKYNPDIVIYIFNGNDLDNNVTIHNANAKFGKSYFELDDNLQLVLHGVPVDKTFIPEEVSLFSYHLNDTQNSSPLKSIGSTIVSSPQYSYSLITSVKDDFRHLAIYRIPVTRLRRVASIKKIFIDIGIMKPDQIPSADENKENEPEVLKYKFQIFEKLLYALHAYSDSIGSKFMVYESYNGVDKPDSSSLHLISKKLNINYYNSHKEFYSRSKGKHRFCFMYDGHWNKNGHKLAAESIGRFLIEKGWVGSYQKSKK